MSTARRPDADRSLRILFPTLAPFPSSRAPTVQVANMAQAFAELGHHVTLVVPAPDRTVAHEPFEQRYGFT
jgi:hypothetical protein